MNREDKRVKRRWAIVLLLAAAVCVSAFAKQKNTSMTHKFTTGVVDIEVEEYESFEESETLYDGHSWILPGEEVSLIPRVTNWGEDCYIRVKIDLAEEGENEDIKEVSFYGMTDAWLLAKDGLYYRKESLKSGEYADVFAGIHFSEDAPKSYESSVLDLHIRVDAIQSKHMTPDYQSDSPWGDTLITKQITQSDKIADYDIVTVGQGKDEWLDIVYKGKAGELFLDDQKLFRTFPVFLPGDSYSDSVRFANRSKDPVKLYFESAYVSDTDLLQFVQLKIESSMEHEEVSETHTLYEGGMRSKTGHTALLNVPAGEEGTLTFTLSMPEDIDNSYTGIENDISWTFSTEQIVKTGDRTQPVIWGMALVLSMVMVIGVVLKRKRRE